MVEWGNVSEFPVRVTPFSHPDSHDEVRVKNPYGHLLSQMGLNMWECPAVKVFTMYTAV